MLRYAITGRAGFPGDEDARQAALLQQVERLAADGVDFIQLREKDLETIALASLARQLLGVVRAHSAATKLLINSRADIAVAVGADGVHLTSAPGSLTPFQIRQLYAAAGLREPVVSVSCHTVVEVSRARKGGADLVLFGPVFEKHVDNVLISVGTGVELLRSACGVAGTVPVLALGGATQENASDCLAAGAAGIAAIRMFAEV